MSDGNVKKLAEILFKDLAKRTITTQPKVCDNKNYNARKKILSQLNKERTDEIAST
jgi:hypothetical protein